MQSSSQNVTTNKPAPCLLQAGCPSCHPPNSVKALKGYGMAFSVAIKEAHRLLFMFLLFSYLCFYCSCTCVRDVHMMFSGNVLSL